MINTFAHIQAPPLLSLWRSVHGFWLGGACSLLFLFVWMTGELLLALTRLNMRKKKEMAQNTGMERKKKNYPE